MRKGTLLICLLALAAGLLAPAALGEGPSRTASTVHLENRERGIYAGEVTSTRPACDQYRTVRVYHDKNLNGFDRADRLIGTDWSDKRGNYAFARTQVPAGDRIVAVLARKKFRDGSVCLGDTVTAIALPG